MGILSFGVKTATAFSLVIMYYFFSFRIIWTYLNPTNVQFQTNFKYDLYRIEYSNSGKSEWISYASYAVIPYFYIKPGFTHTLDSLDLITVTSICDIDLLYEAQKIASNYKTGPVSFAIYIDENYLTLNTTNLYQIIQQHFFNISTGYDITVGIVAVNTSSQFYVSTSKARHFDADTPMMFKVPTNVLRNLAEHQVETNWILNIDIDFWFMSDTLNDKDHVLSVLHELNTIISSAQFGLKTVFVVPAFEILSATETFEYNSLTKKQLTDLIYLEEISAFHEGMMAQKCTNYEAWYEASKPYYLDFKKVFCYFAYEPWFIIHRNMSRSPLYRWNNSYIGRGLNKVERVYRLRHFCFNFIVMHNLFMIHAPDSRVTHHAIVGDEIKQKWHEYNLNLLNAEMEKYSKDSRSCVRARIGNPVSKRKQTIKSRYHKHRADLYCENGILSKSVTEGYCKVCCPRRCNRCGGRGCGRIHPSCCVGNILASKRFCNESRAPCQLTVNEHCTKNMMSEVDFVSIP